MDFNFTETFLDEERLKLRCSVLDFESLKSVKVITNKISRVDQLTKEVPDKLDFEPALVEIHEILTTLFLQKKEVVHFYLQARKILLSMSLFLEEIVCLVYKFKLLRILDRFFWCLKKLLVIGCDIFDLQYKILDSFSYVYMRKEKGSSVYVINKKKTKLSFNSHKAKSNLKLKNLLVFEKKFFSFLSITEILIAHFKNVKEMFPVSDYWVLLFKIEGVSIKKKQKLEKKEVLLKRLFNVYCLIIAVHLDLFLKFLKLFSNNVAGFSNKNKDSDFVDFNLRVRVLEKNVGNFFLFFDKFYYVVYQEYFVLIFFKTAMILQRGNFSILRKKNAQKVYIVQDLDIEKNSKDENIESAIFRKVRKKKIKKYKSMKVLWSPETLAKRAAHAKALAAFEKRVNTGVTSKVEPKIEQNSKVETSVEVESPVKVEPVLARELDSQLDVKSKNLFKHFSKKKIEENSDISKSETILKSKVKSKLKPNFEKKSKNKSGVFSKGKGKAKSKLKTKLQSKIGLESKPKKEIKSESKPKLTSKVKPEVKSETKPELKFKPKLKVKSETKPELKSKSKLKLKSETTPELKFKPKLKVKSETKSELKSNTKPKTKSKKKVKSKKKRK